MGRFGTGAKSPSRRGETRAVDSRPASLQGTPASPLTQRAAVAGQSRCLRRNRNVPTPLIV